MVKYYVVVISGLLFLTLFLLFMLTNPLFGNISQKENPIEVNKDALYRHVATLSMQGKPRNFENLESLDSCAAYIFEEFKSYGLQPYEQNFMVDGKEYKNIICNTGPENKPVIVVGTHYDVCGDQPGADDNASGVAGMLELARLFSQDTTLGYRLEFVAYTLEEPPYFRTEYMGSAVHANTLKKNNIEVKAMLCLEMIGYFSEEAKSQKYPSVLLKPFYPSKGDFILVVGKFGENKLLRKIKRGMRDNSSVDVRSINAPNFVTGVDFSDHLNYWALGYPAVMVTNTSFYRNFNYHKAGDTIETLDFDKMKEVVSGIYGAIKNL